MNVTGRFWRNVTKTATCWLWTGRVNKDGYGVSAFGGPGRAAHRGAWILSYGPIPHGMNVCHVCDVRICVRPDHLFIGTQAENMRDMVAKGRSLSGENNTQSKLTEHDVREIRRLRGVVTQTALSERFGVRQGVINSVQLRQSWKSVQ